MLWYSFVVHEVHVDRVKSIHATIHMMTCSPDFQMEQFAPKSPLTLLMSYALTTKVFLGLFLHMFILSLHMPPLNQMDHTSC